MNLLFEKNVGKKNRFWRILNQSAEAKSKDIPSCRDSAGVYSVCVLKSISRSSFTTRMLHLMYKQVKSEKWFMFILGVRIGRVIELLHDTI